MQRMAGNNPIMQQMQADMEENQRRMAQLAAETQQRIKEQTKRDVAAAYGKVIPFD